MFQQEKSPAFLLEEALEKFEAKKIKKLSDVYIISPSQPEINPSGDESSDDGENPESHRWVLAKGASGKAIVVKNKFNDNEPLRLCKVIKKESAASTAISVSHCCAEIAVLSLLSHPNLNKLVGLFHSATKLFLILELVGGSKRMRPDVETRVAYLIAQYRPHEMHTIDEILDAWKKLAMEQHGIDADSTNNEDVEKFEKFVDEEQLMKKLAIQMGIMDSNNNNTNNNNNNNEQEKEESSASSSSCCASSPDVQSPLLQQQQQQQQQQKFERGRMLAKRHLRRNKNKKNQLDESEVANKLPFPVLPCEMITQGDLVSLIRSHKIVPDPLIRIIMRQTLLALEYLHAHHICHRDIKSDNICVAIYRKAHICRDENSKITGVTFYEKVDTRVVDLGLSKYLDLSFYGQCCDDNNNNSDNSNNNKKPTVDSELKFATDFINAIANCSNNNNNNSNNSNNNKKSSEKKQKEKEETEKEKEEIKQDEHEVTMKPKENNNENENNNEMLQLNSEDFEEEEKEVDDNSNNNKATTKNLNSGDSLSSCLVDCDSPTTSCEPQLLGKREHSTGGSADDFVGLVAGAPTATTTTTTANITTNNTGNNTDNNATTNENNNNNKSRKQQEQEKAEEEEEEQNAEMTISVSTTTGTETCCPPEVIAAIRKLDYSTFHKFISTNKNLLKMDSFASGVVAATMATGRPYFSPPKLRTRQERLEAIEKQIQEPRVYPSFMSEACKNFCEKMLTNEVKDRPTIPQALKDKFVDIGDDNILVTHIDVPATKPAMIFLSSALWKSQQQQQQFQTTTNTTNFTTPSSSGNMMQLHNNNSMNNNPRTNSNEMFQTATSGSFSLASAAAVASSNTVTAIAPTTTSSASAAAAAAAGRVHSNNSSSSNGSNTQTTQQRTNSTSLSGFGGMITIPSCEAIAPDSPRDTEGLVSAGMSPSTSIQFQTFPSQTPPTTLPPLVPRSNTNNQQQQQEENHVLQQQESFGGGMLLSENLGISSSSMSETEIIINNNAAAAATATTTTTEELKQRGDGVELISPVCRGDNNIITATTTNNNNTSLRSCLLAAEKESNNDPDAVVVVTSAAATDVVIVSSSFEEKNISKKSSSSSDDETMKVVRSREDDDCDLDD